MKELIRIFCMLPFILVRVSPRPTRHFFCWPAHPAARGPDFFLYYGNNNDYVDFTYNVYIKY